VLLLIFGISLILMNVKLTFMKINIFNLVDFPGDELETARTSGGDRSYPPQEDMPNKYFYC
jgi:hypothetical protein